MKFAEEQKPTEENVQAKPNTVDVELNEDQLEAVAGGGVKFPGGGGFLNPIIVGPIIDLPAPTGPMFPTDLPA